MRIIELKNLSKIYRNPVLQDINYTFEKGKTYLVIGENGSGKTTLIRLICGLINPSNGIVDKVSNDISYVPDNLNFPDFLNVYKFLYNLGLIYKISRSKLDELINNLLEEWELDKNYKMKELSKGMRQKVLIINSILRNGDIYIYDEPLNGLDKDMQIMFIQEIKKLKELEKTIIIISHQANKFKKIYDYKLIIKNGIIYEEPNSLSS